MGNCGSNGASVSAVNKTINSSLEMDKKKAKKEMKLLLLGAGESGKSTVFKQVRLIHDHTTKTNQRQPQTLTKTTSSMDTRLNKDDLTKGFSEEERMVMAGMVQKQCVEYLRVLVDGAETFGLLDGQSLIEANKLIARIEAEGVCDESVEAVTKLWASDEIQQTYARRAALQLPDASKHFLNKFAKVMAHDFVPTDEDMLLSRVRTTGVSEMRFQIDNISVRLVDVGGQRSERRKWIHCFDDVEAVIFVSAINEYDQVLFEDNQTNRLIESLKLFSEVSNSRFFGGAAKILFLNKKDLFEEKIRQVDLSVCFPEYKDGLNYDYALSFLEQKFREQYKHDKHELYVHVTCATSTGNIRFVFESIRDTVLAFNFNAAGLL